MTMEQYSDKKTSFEIRLARPEDAEAMAEVHITVFKDSFLTLLHRKALKKFYDFFIHEPFGISLVCIADGKIVGFGSGWEKGASYQRPLIKKHGAYFFWRLLIALAKNPSSFKFLSAAKFRTLFQYGMQAFQFKKAEKKNEIAKPVFEPVNATFLSLALLENYQGIQAGKALRQAFLDECRRRGVREVWLTVRLDNQRARQFYDKAGWKFLRQHDDLMDYRWIL